MTTAIPHPIQNQLPNVARAVDQAVFDGLVDGGRWVAEPELVGLARDYLEIHFPDGAIQHFVDALPYDYRYLDETDAAQPIGKWYSFRPELTSQAAGEEAWRASPLGIISGTARAYDNDEREALVDLMEEYVQTVESSADNRRGLLTLPLLSSLFKSAGTRMTKLDLYTFREFLSQDQARFQLLDDQTVIFKGPFFGGMGELEAGIAERFGVLGAIAVQVLPAVYVSCGQRFSNARLRKVVRRRLARDPTAQEMSVVIDALSAIPEIEIAGYGVYRFRDAKALLQQIPGVELPPGIIRPGEGAM